MSDKPSKQRAFVGGVVIQWGMVNMPVDFVPGKVSGTDKVGSFHRLCPTCADPTRLRERSVCDNGHGPFDTEDLDDNPRSGKTVDGTLIEVSQDEVAAVKGADLPKSMWELEFCPADQFEAAAFPDGTFYRLRPGKVNVDGPYAVLRDLALDRSVAVHGEVNLKGSQKPYRLVVWGGMLFAQGFIRPDDMAECEGVDATAIEKHVVLARQLAAADMGDYDPQAHVNRKRQREAELIAAKAADPNAVVAITTTPAPVPTKVDDLAAQLEAMLAAKAA